MTLPRILLVDDDSSRSQQLETILQFMEYSVTATPSAHIDTHLAAITDDWLIFIAHTCAHFNTLVHLLDKHTAQPKRVLIIDKEHPTHYLTFSWVASIVECPITYPELSRTLQQFSTSDNTASLPTLDHSTQHTSAPEHLTLLRSAAINPPPAQPLSPLFRLQGDSTQIAMVRHLISQVAESNATVLILGESGTGKEVVARILHDLSNRHNKLFVPINCGAIPAELLESELFGHEKGAFTGALSARQGRFEMAEGGTLFLDEIGDMPMPMQVKLLRVLQERTFERVGSNKTIHANVRVIAATHRCLEYEIQENRFREDLFYRLNVFPIEIPALRERADDIPVLIAHFASTLADTPQGDALQLTPAALRLLMDYTWPGNIRELANLIERLAIIYPNKIISADDLPEKFQRLRLDNEHQEDNSRANETEEPALNAAEEAMLNALLTSSAPLNPLDKTTSNLTLPEHGIDLKEYLNEMEIDLIRQALEECNGVVAHAAKRLNMRRTTLVEKLRKFDLQR